MAVQHGVDVVYVSNHGGRQLDHGRRHGDGNADTEIARPGHDKTRRGRAGGGFPWQLGRPAAGAGRTAQPWRAFSRGFFLFST